MLDKLGLNGAAGTKMSTNGAKSAMHVPAASEGVKMENMPGNSSAKAKSDQNAGKNQAADNLAAVERYHANAAIEFVENYLENFTTEGGNKWNTVRNMLTHPDGYSHRVARRCFDSGKINCCRRLSRWYRRADRPV